MFSTRVASAAPAMQGDWATRQQQHGRHSGQAGAWPRVTLPLVNSGARNGVTVLHIFAIAIGTGILASS